MYFRSPFPNFTCYHPIHYHFQMLPLVNSINFNKPSKPPPQHEYQSISTLPRKSLPSTECLIVLLLISQHHLTHTYMHTWLNNNQLHQHVTVFIQLLSCLSTCLREERERDRAHQEVTHSACTTNTFFICTKGEKSTYDEVVHYAQDQITCTTRHSYYPPPSLAPTSKMLIKTYSQFGLHIRSRA